MLKQVITFLALVAIGVSAAPQPLLVAPPVVTAQSSQYIARNHNALVQPIIAQPFITEHVVARQAVFTNEAVFDGTQPIFSSALTQPIFNSALTQPFFAAASAEPIFGSAYTQPILGSVPAEPIFADDAHLKLIAASEPQLIDARSQPIRDAQPVRTGAQPMPTNKLIAARSQPVRTGAQPMFTNKLTAARSQPIRDDAQAGRSALVQPVLSQQQNKNNRVTQARTAKLTASFRPNPAAETFEPVARSAPSDDNKEANGGDVRQAHVDTVAQALAPSVLAAKYLRAPVVNYYNAYVQSPYPSDPLYA